MPRCPFCDHPNSPGTERCEGCGAWVIQGEGPTSDRDRIPEGGTPHDLAGHEDDVEGRVRSLLAEGRKIEAIKVYREATGAGLKEAKDAVEAINRGIELSTPVDGGDDVEGQLLSLLGRGEKIQAIKLYREATGAGLKEAKDAVEALTRGHGFTPKATGCAGLFLLALGLCGALSVVLGGLVRSGR
jgi:large subunit ribosomal protein L7/L12